MRHPCTWLCCLLCISVSASTHRVYITQNGGATPGALLVAADNRPAEMDVEGNWGTPAEGFQLGVRFSKTDYISGERVEIVVYDRNISEQVLQVHLGSMHNYLLQNSFGDIVRSGLLDPAWYPGSYQFNIPFKWQVGENGAIHDFPDNVAKVEIDGNGTVIVTKFGRSVTRAINQVYGTSQ